MTELMLKSVKASMEALHLNYGFLTYDNKPVSYPYFVGEYTETESFTEDGLQEATFILTGFSRGQNAVLSLEEAKEDIKEYFSQEGKVFVSNDGTTAVIMYGYSFPVPKEDAELKSIQINLSVKEWSVI